jgi:hypothetical protein
VDESGEEAERPRKPGAWRSVLLSLAAGAIFAAFLVTYLSKTMKLPVGPVLVATSDAGPRRPDALEVAQQVASAFVASLGTGDYAGAYAQMARPYRERVPFATFRDAWRTPLLASPRAIKLTRAETGSVQLDGAFVPGATFTARGMMACAAGALDTSLTFLREPGGAHVLAVVVGGVPIVQGLGPATAPPQ